MELKFNTTNRVGDLTFLGSIMVTPSIAEELLKKNIGNRKLNEKRVSSYARDMKSHDWYAMPDGLTITVDREWHILNGQHRLKAIIRSDTPTEMYFCQKDIDGTAATVVTDIGFNRNLSMLMKLSTWESATISSVIQLGSALAARITVADCDKFINKLTEKEREFIHTLGTQNKKGITAAVRAGFFYRYVETNSDEIIEYWNDFISSNEYNPITNRLWIKINNIPKGSIVGSSRETYFANFTYGILSGYSSARIAKSKDSTISLMRRLYQEIMERQFINKEDVDEI